MRNNYKEKGFFETYENPTEYAGCLIFEITPEQFDIVKAGECIGQRRGLGGAKACADSVVDLETPTFRDVQARLIDRYKIKEKYANAHYL